MNEQGLYDIYGHVHIPFWQSRLFYVGIIITFCLLVLLVLFIFIKKYFKNILTHEQKAQRALALLKESPVHTRKQAHEVYFKLTDIIKSFFQEHYRIPFSSMTDQEMLDVLNRISFPNHLILPLQELVESSVNVKYAAEDTIKERVLQHIQIGETIVIELAKSKEKK